MSQSTQLEPVYFLGHGSPMNAIADNEYTRTLNRIGKRHPNPTAVLCVSAHWLTQGTWITRMSRPRTIHDFYGFPPELFAVQYPAPGSTELADKIRASISKPEIQPDNLSWGLDHGTWSVLRHLYPEAQVPVLQLSIDIAQPPRHHFNIGRALRPLREEGILIIGSGNIVHNLRKILPAEDAPAFDWAIEFDEWVQDHLNRGEVDPLLDHLSKSEIARLSVPTPDHYYPFAYTLGAATETELPRVEFAGMQNGSISMRCLSWGS